MVLELSPIFVNLLYGCMALKSMRNLRVAYQEWEIGNKLFTLKNIHFYLAAIIIAKGR